VQWCHGAPGIITSCTRAAIDHQPTRDLLLGGGELTWHAGPLAKGSTICHGTAGNALAFLELFQLTDDELWLDRARSFAMHALAQVRARRAEVGRGRHSLFTGDVGVAAVLVQCIDGRPGILGLDQL
jgi:lantibiotic modifying enzyme